MELIDKIYTEQNGNTSAVKKQKQWIERSKNQIRTSKMETAHPPPPKKVLVVDDDRYIREIIMTILEEEGHHVSGLDNGAVVVWEVEHTHPDLVLLDIQLGDRDGRDICRELKQQYRTKNIPIIMISANHAPKALIDKECKADDFLAKPFDIQELMAHVRRFAA